MNLGLAVKSLRIKAGLTQAQLAEKAGVNQSSISRLERSRQSVTVTKFARIAQALGVKEQAIIDLAHFGDKDSEDSEEWARVFDAFWESP